MIFVRVLLLPVLAILPLVPVVFTLPIIRTIAVIGLLGFWMLDPSWGSWVYVGICLNLMWWRAWQLYIQRLSMSIYVSSPSMGMQNSSSVWLAIGAAIGAIRSLAGGDFTGVVLGGIVAMLLFGLQGNSLSQPGSNTAGMWISDGPFRRTCAHTGKSGLSDPSRIQQTSPKGWDFWTHASRGLC